MSCRLIRLFFLANGPRQPLLLVLLSEEREVDITLGMCLEILQEAVGTGHGAVQIVVKLSVGKQLAHRTLGVLQLLNTPLA